MKKLLFSLFVLLLLTTVSAFSPTSPADVSLACGDYASLDIVGVFTNITDIADHIFVRPLKTGVAVGFDYKNLNDGGNTLKVLIMTNANYCTPGSTYTEFNIGSDNYRIDIELLKEEYSLGEKLISTNEALNIGQDISFGVLGIGDGSVHYILQGCQSVSEEDTMTDEISMTCSGNIDLRIKLLFTLPELGTGVAKFEVFSSEPGFILTKSNKTVDDGDSSECKLGLSNEGTIISRGKLLTFTTINTFDGKPQENIVVTLIDPGGDVADYSAKSNYIGFFSHKISEEFKEDHLIVQLVDMDGNCEPLPLGRYDFEKSYDDYKAGKEEEEGGFQLVLNMSARYELGAISGTIKNLLNEVIEGVEVKITNPDNSVISVQSGVNGVFSWTPTICGAYKIQGGKDDYESTDLVSIEVFENKQYLIVIKVNGEQKAEYKKGDRINFELRDINNSLVPLTIDATFAGLPLKFIGGISDTTQFEGTSNLDIPAVEGYTAQSITLTEKQTNTADILWIIGIIVGIIVVLILVVAIVKRTRGDSTKSPTRKMEFQLGGEESK